MEGKLRIQREAWGCGISIEEKNRGYQEETKLYVQ